VPDAKKTLPPGEITAPQTLEELRAFSKRSQMGDPKSQPTVQPMLGSSTEVLILSGELSAAVVKAFATSLVGQDPRLCEAIRRKADLLREELLGDTITPAERLLVDRVVSCWLQLQGAELRCAQLPADTDYDDVEICLRRMDAANRRFLATIRMLAQVRKYI
jgi:hypothetical protein